MRRLVSSPAFRIAVGVGLLAWLFTMLDLRSLPAAIVGARLDYLGLLAAVMFATRLVGAFRWYVLLRGLNQNVSYLEVVRLTFVSEFMGYFTPGSLGIEATRLYGMARITSNPAHSATSILMERLLAALALIALVLTGLAFEQPGIPREVGTLAWGALALFVAGTIGLMSEPLRAATSFLLLRFRLRRLDEVARKVYRSLDEYGARPMLLGGTFVLSIVFQLLRCAAVAVGALAFGVQLPFLAFVIIVPVINFVSMVPISIGGLGVREAGFVYLFGRVGMPAEVALAVSLVMRVLVVLIATPGLWFYARRGVVSVNTTTPPPSRRPL